MTFRGKSVEQASEDVIRARQDVQRRYGRSPKRPSVLYHYCRYETLRMILDSRVLRASDALRAKDGTELVYALGVVRKFANERVDGSPRYYISGVPERERAKELLGEFETYIACLSANERIPSQWKDYAEGGRGWAIGFDSSATTSLSGEKTFLGPFPMLYNYKVQKKLIHTFLTRATEIYCKLPCPEDRRILHSIANREIFALCIVLKDSRFHSEEEWRLFVVQNDEAKRYESQLDDAGRRFVELPICSPQTIVEVVVGPRNEASEALVLQMLANAGLAGVRVRRSNVVL